MHSEKPMRSEPVGFQYGLAKSRTENPQVMGRADNTRGNCRCGPPLPDELQRSWIVNEHITKGPGRRTFQGEHAAHGSYRLLTVEREAFILALLAHSLLRDIARLADAQR